MSGAELEGKARIAQQAGANVEIVGAWVWAACASKPPVDVRETLKAEGYHWNHTRGVWQFAGVPCRQSPASAYEIKAKYGVQELEEARA